MHIIEKAEIEAVRKVIEGRQFSRYRGGEGGYTEKFEKALCKKLNIEHALTVNSGTSALICALVGMGIGPGDEVIVPAYTWIATALAPLAVGAVPILADVDESLTLDPKDIERKITKYTKAIIPVHMRNLVCNMNAIMKIAKKHNLLVCEDACQAVGVSYKKKRVGTIAQAGAFSFNQFKNITCGEGGVVLTNDTKIYERALIYHDVGSFYRENVGDIQTPFFSGINFRVSEIQGAILGEQLKRMDGILGKISKRRAVLMEILSRSKKFKVSPHHDKANAIGLTLLFKTSKEAEYFAKRPELDRFIDSGLHVYTNWEPLMKQRVSHPKMNPYKWAHRKIKYNKSMCKKTLDILARSCNVIYKYDTPLAEIKKMAKTLINY